MVVVIEAVVAGLIVVVGSLWLSLKLLCAQRTNGLNVNLGSLFKPITI